MAERLRIDRLGHRGDGIAETPEGPVYVPFTLPGEEVSVNRSGERAELVEVVAPGPARVEPVCAHFGACGGCTVQHLGRADQLSWKRDLVAGALRQRGLDISVEDPVTVPERSRRRAVFAARRVGREIVLGYRERHAHRIVPVAECPVVLPGIADALPHLREWLAPLVPRKQVLRVAVTATATGLDIALEGIPEPDPAVVAKLAGSRPAGLDVARLSVHGEPVLANAEPVIEIGGIAVDLPPASFLQAVEAAETAMADLVTAWLDGASAITDLYAGLGAFALRLARIAPVTAVESDRAALDALAMAARRASGLKAVETLRRDLDRQPLSARELARFSALVFDPPRAGAKAQAEEIARARVRRVAAVSCNPATLARDLRILVDGGYRLRRVVPVDQFIHSAHIEAVALLETDE